MISEKKLFLPNNCNIFTLSYVYIRYNDNLKPMKVIKFIILVNILVGSCFMTGCDDENDVEDDPFIIVSNVFAPDSNGKNVFFEVTEKGNNEVSLKIYTRAGVLVYSIEAVHCVWNGCSLNGQPMAAGIYHYTAEVRDSSPKISKCGFVQLYR